MKPVRLLVQFFCWAICVVGLNLAIERASRQSIPRQVARNIDRSLPITDLFVGNSLMAAGFEAEPFARARPGLRALNIGLGSSSPVEHNILMRRALRLDPRRVYYGYFDAQLFEPMPGGWDGLVGNRAMAYYLDLETAIRFYATGDPFRAGLMRIIARVPLMVERYAIWARVEKLRRGLGGIGRRAVPVNRFGRAEDFSLLEYSDDDEFRRICRSAVEGHKGLVPPVVDMIRSARDRGISFMVIEMPMTEGHRRRFYDQPEWIRLREYTGELVGREGGTYLVASDWIGDDGFTDHLHLNERGAAEFSRRIAAAIIIRP